MAPSTQSSADRSYTPTGVTLMAALVYNKTKVSAPPATWQQLLQPQWKGNVGMNDPSQSGPTYPFIAGMMNYLGGVSKGEGFFSQLKSNGLIIHPTNGPTLQALTSGQIKLALVQSSAGIGAVLGDKVHGAGRAATLRLIVPMLAPAIWSALAIGFAESISDFGVAATLAYNSNFSLATYQLYAAIGNFPPSFSAASSMGALLVAAVAIPLALQARALRGRSCQMLSGRTRQVVRRQLSRPGTWMAVAGVVLFYVVALGVPGFGAVSGSLLGLGPPVPEQGAVRRTAAPPSLFCLLTMASSAARRSRLPRH